MAIDHRRRSVGALAALAILAQTMPGGAMAAPCATGRDAAALKIAALQQELMVAALSCHDEALYNRFVVSHQPELFASDGRLKAYFIASRFGEAGYNTFKTELANKAALGPSRDAGAFCARASDEFAAMDDLDTLSSYVAAHNIELVDDMAVCAVPVVQSASLAGRPAYFAPVPHAPMDEQGGP